MQEYYSKKFPNYPTSSIKSVNNINSELVIEFTKKSKPEAILISGTRIIKDEVLRKFKGIPTINLHTGLSPYVKGGPNCTNWCIARKMPEYIGNTVMWIDEGIDTGDILFSNQISFHGEETLSEIHIMVMENAHEILLHSVGMLEKR